MKSAVYEAITHLMENLSEYEMDELAKLMRYRANTMASEDIEVGDRVSVMDNVKGLRRGILVKKNHKNFVVRINKKLYDVPRSIIKKVWY
jgi:hypothetical protein